MLRIYVTNSGVCVSSLQTDQHHSRTQFTVRTYKKKPAYFVGAFDRSQIGRKAMREAARDVLRKHLGEKIPQLRYTKLLPKRKRNFKADRNAIRETNIVSASKNGNGLASSNSALNHAIKAAADLPNKPKAMIFWQIK